MRSLVLPKPPKGYNNIPSHLSYASTQYEIMLMRTGVVGDKSGQLMYDQFKQHTKSEQMLGHWEISGVQRWITHGFRTIYPSSEIMDACKNTEVLTSVMGSDIRVSIPSFMIVIPKGKEWVDTRGAKATHIVVNVREDEPTVTYFGGEITQTMPMPSPRYLTVTLFWDNLMSQSSCIPLEEDNQSLGEIISKYTTGGEHHIASRQDALLTNDDMEGDRKIGHDVDEFVANALLIMQSYPEYLSTTVKKARGFNTKKMTRKVKVSMFATPSHLRQTVYSTPKGKKDRDGTRTLKTHMRRGHWRRQRHNIQWEADNPEVSVVIMADGGNAHMVWIRPVMVEGNKE